MKSLEQRIRQIEDMITEIHAVVVMGKTPMTLYLQRGGKVLKAEEVYGPAAVQKGGSNASRHSKPGRRSANLPTDATARSRPLSKRKKK